MTLNRLQKESNVAMNAFHKLSLAVALATGALTMSTAGSASAQTTVAPQIAADSTLLTVNATGKTSRQPDVANFSTGVVTRNADANAAMRANAELMAKVIAALKKEGVAAKDIQTSGINLNPDYTYRDNQPPVINGYNASNTVNVKVRDMSRIGKIMDVLVANGANQINGPSFAIDDEISALNEARKDALKQAQARAQLYAHTLGLNVRRIVSIDEGSSPRVFYARPMMADARAMGKAESTPIETGETAVEVALNIVFELGR